MFVPRAVVGHHNHVGVGAPAPAHLPRHPPDPVDEVLHGRPRLRGGQHVEDGGDLLEEGAVVPPHRGLDVGVEVHPVGRHGRDLVDLPHG